MYSTPPQALWDHLVRELFSYETALYVLGTVIFFGVIALVLEFLDATRGHDQ